jgi:Putative glycosyl hydrolase domain
VIRPWLQAFAWRTKTYSPQYIETQVRSSRLNGGDGFLFWNARNDYGKPFAAMPVMTADASVYFEPLTVAAEKPVPAPAPAAQPEPVINPTLR